MKHNWLLTKLWVGFQTERTAVNGGLQATPEKLFLSTILNCRNPLALPELFAAERHRLRNSISSLNHSPAFWQLGIIH